MGKLGVSLALGVAHNLLVLEDSRVGLLEMTGRGLVLVQKVDLGGGWVRVSLGSGWGNTCNTRTAVASLGDVGVAKGNDEDFETGEAGLVSDQRLEARRDPWWGGGTHMRAVLEPRLPGAWKT